MTHTDPSRDLPSTMIYEAADGHTVTLQLQQGRYPFWEIKIEGKELPKELLGVWTGYSEANRAIEIYLERVKRELNESKEGKQVPKEAKAKA